MFSNHAPTPYSCYNIGSLQDVSHGDDGDRFYGTRVWDARKDSCTDAAARKLVDFYCGGLGGSVGGVAGGGRGASWRDAADKRPWERVVDDVQRRFDAELDESTSASFRRPAAKTDRLHAVIEPGTDPVLVKHPAPPAGREHLARDGLPNVRCGTVASGRLVADNAAWRLEVRSAAGLRMPFAIFITRCRREISGCSSMKEPNLQSTGGTQRKEN